MQPASLLRRVIPNKNKTHLWHPCSSWHTNLLRLSSDVQTIRRRSYPDLLAYCEAKTVIMLPLASGETPILQQEQCWECNLWELVVKWLVKKALYLEIRMWIERSAMRTCRCSNLGEILHEFCSLRNEIPTGCPSIQLLQVCVFVLALAYFPYSITRGYIYIYTECFKKNDPNSNNYIQ
jgi:hypothetical protein